MRDEARSPLAAFIIRHFSFVIYHLSFIIFPLLLLWRPLFADGAFYWGTPLLQFVPWQRLAAEMWRGGHLPLWNPLVGCGAPLAANYQTAAFYPLNVLYLLLPAEVALNWTTALHLALAGWGMYHWGRAVGLERLPAFLGALAFEGSGFLVTRIALFPSMAFTFPWLAIWLWRGELLAQHGRLRDALWLGAALGLGLLAGHAQTAFYGGVLLAAYFIFRTAQVASGKRQVAGDRWQVIGGRWWFFLLALVLGVALAAVQLLPTAELMLQSQRSGGVDEAFGMTYSFWPWRLITFLAPDFFGNPGHGDYWGYAAYWEDAGYVGLLPLLLAVGGGVAALRRRRGDGVRRRGEIAFWLLAAGCALLLALGQNTPVFPFLFRYVPTFNLFQSPTRWLAVVTLALAALAALGAQRWLMRRTGRRWGPLGIVFGAALLIGGLAAQYIVPGLLPTFGPATAWLGGALIAAGALATLRRDAAWWRAAVAAFVVLDLLLFGWPLVPTVDLALYRGAGETAATLENDAAPQSARVYWPTDPARRDREYDAENRVKFSYLVFDDFGPRDAGHWREMREALVPNAGMLDGVASVNNFDPLLVGRHVELLRTAVEAPGLLRVMGATHVVSDRSWPGAEQVGAAGPAAVYRLPDSLGRAWVVPNARYVLSSGLLSALADPDFDPAAEVLFEAESLSFSPPPANPSVDWQILALHDGPNRVTIRAALDGPGYLVLADTWYPGWQAEVDGEPAALLRANYAFRAVALGVGEHTVEMVYRPVSVLAGGVVSLVTVVLLAAGLALLYRKRVSA